MGQGGADVGFYDMGSTGSKTVSGLSYQPKGLIGMLHGNGHNVGLAWTVALSDMTDAGSYMFAGQYPDGQTPLYANDSYSVKKTDYVWAKAIKVANLVGEATFTSVNSDGFTFNVTDADNWNYSHLSWGGGQSVVKTGQFAPSGSTGNQSVTGIGFQPNAVIFFVTEHGADEGNQQHAKFILGWMAENGGQHLVSHGVSAGSGYGYGWQKTDACIIAQTSTITGQASYVSMDSGGFTINWSNAMGTDKYVHYMAIGGVEAYAGNDAFRASTGTFSKSGFGFQPDVIIGATRGDQNTGMGFATSPTQADQAYQQFSHWHGQDPSVADQNSNDGLFLLEMSYTGSAHGWIDVHSFDSDGVTFNQLDVGEQNTFGFLAFKIKQSVPDQVTGVSATDGTYTDKVQVTWSSTSDTTGYDVWNGSTWVDVGNVLTYDHTTAPAGYITLGSCTASDGTSTAHVVLTATGSGGVSNNGSSVSYKVRAYNAAGDGPESSINTGYRTIGSVTRNWYRDATPLGQGGTPYNDTGAAAPTITPGTCTASDGSSSLHVVLDASGYSTSNGTTYTYKAKYTATGASNSGSYSTTNTGYRGVGSLVRDWEKSAIDSDANYSSTGQSADPHNYTGAPAPTITGGTAAATDGTGGNGLIDLSVSSQSGNNGAGRWYRCKYTATGASTQYTSGNRGYRGTTTLTYLWYMSNTDGDSGYGSIGLTTEDPANYGGAPDATITPGTTVASDGSSTAHVALNISGESLNQAAGRYFKVYISMSGASSVYSSPNRGYNGVGSLTYLWYRSSGDSDANYSSIGLTTEAANDTGAPAPTITPGTCTATNGDSTAHVTLDASGYSTSIGAGRYYKCDLNAAGASGVTSAPNRGHRGVGSLVRLWYRSAADSDASYSSIGQSADPYNDTGAPAPTITGGSASATDGTGGNSYIDLSLTSAAGNNGAGRYYKAYYTAVGATAQYSTFNRGYRGTTTLTYLWYMSAADSDANYSSTGLTTQNPTNYSGGPNATITPGTCDATDGTIATHVQLSVAGESVNEAPGRYFKCLVSMSGAADEYSSANRGYQQTGPIRYEWYRSAADSDANYSILDADPSTDPFSDTTAPINGDGRYYKCLILVLGAANTYTTVNRGYRASGSAVFHSMNF